MRLLYSLRVGIGLILTVASKLTPRCFLLEVVEVSSSSMPKDEAMELSEEKDWREYVRSHAKILAEDEEGDTNVDDGGEVDVSGKMYFRSVESA